MTLTRKLTAGAAAIIATLGLATLAPAEARADCGAPGKLHFREIVLSPENKQMIASLDVYYSKRTGRYSACMEHRGKKSRGKALFTRVSMGWCYVDFCRSLFPGVWAFDEGNFRYYAGPISLPGRCLSIHGSITDPYSGKRVNAAIKGVGGNCNFDKY